MIDKPETLIARANALATSIKDNTKALESFNAKIRRGRRLVVTLACSVVFSVILSIGLIFALRDAHDAQTRANEISRELCESRNDQSARERRLWDIIVAFYTPDDGPPLDQEALDDFNELLDETFLRLDCTPRG